ncbi:MAG: L-lactate dehydrogenase [Clostridiales bacterium]|nr:MAG: L-lactate dehydrogenase [Clostridiales bacterium]
MAISRNAVAIVGAGSVGSAVGYAIINQGICDDVFLVDKNQDKAKAEAIDLENCIEFLNRNMRVTVKEFKDLRDVDIIVMTAAAPYKEGQTRLDMIDGSLSIINSIVPKIMESGFCGQFIIITNPVDVISYYIYNISGLPKNKIIGTGTALDSARLKNIISETVDVDPRSIHAFTMGEHGDSQMIPWSSVRIGGKLWKDIMHDNPELFTDKDFHSKVLADVIDMGWKIMRSKGSTNYGIASTTVGIIKAIMHDENKIIPVSTLLCGEYGHRNVFAGVPAIINKTGVKEIVEIKMTNNEKAEFDKSVQVIMEYSKNM